MVYGKYLGCVGFGVYLVRCVFGYDFGGVLFVVYYFCYGFFYVLLVVWII